jgi:hypothetical protein
VAEPSVAFGLTNAERKMAHAQARMPMLLGITVRPAEILCQEKELLFLPFPHVLWKDRAQQWIGFDTAIERVNETAERLIATNAIIDKSRMERYRRFHYGSTAGLKIARERTTVGAVK